MLFLLVFCDYLHFRFLRGTEYSTQVFVRNTISCLLFSHNAIYIWGVAQLLNPLPVTVSLQTVRQKRKIQN